MTRKARADRLRAALAAISHARLGLMAAIVAGLAVLLTLGDPGLTIDEPLDVRPGRTYVATLQASGLAILRAVGSSSESSMTMRSTPLWDAGCWAWPRDSGSLSRSCCLGPTPRGFTCSRDGLPLPWPLQYWSES